MRFRSCRRVGVGPPLPIKLLLNGASGFRKAFKALAAVLQNNRDKSKLLEITESAAATISLLRAAFR